MNKKCMLAMCALLLALALAFPALPAYAENNGYVKNGSGSINLRSGPATQYRVLAAIAPGTPLEVVDVVGKWAHLFVANPNGEGKLEGYMYTDFIEYYNPTASSEVVPSYSANDYYNYYSYNNYGNKSITEYTTMYVNTGNTGRLHLREGASQNARSLGLYANGTKVTVLNRSSSGWSYVDVNGTRGFMMLKYLSVNQQYYPQPSYGAVTKYIYTGNSGRLHLREYPSQDARSLGLFPNGTQVSATDLGNGWSYVTFGGYSGYMMNKFLSSSKPSVNPTPYNPTQYKVRYVCIANGHVSLRSAMSDSSSALGNYANGTVVYLIYDYGTWSYVFVNGQYGYMKNSWLGTSPYVPDPSPVTPIGTAVVQHPNGSFVYLRSSRSTADLSNVLAKVPSGAVVTVYQKDEWYSLISYNGVKGYMVSSYLYGSAGGSVPSPSVPSTGEVYQAVALSKTNIYSDMQGSTVVGSVPAGGIVKVYNENNGWLAVVYNGSAGWVKKGSFVTVPASQNPSPSQTAASIPSIPLMPAIPTVTDPPESIPSIPLMPAIPSSETQTDGAGNIMYVDNPNSTYVNLRSSKDSSSNSNVIAYLYNGTSVKVLEYGEYWCLVQSGSVKGYMVTHYLSNEK